MKLQNDAPEALIDQAIALLHAIKRSRADDLLPMPKCDILPSWKKTDQPAVQTILVYWAGCAGLGQLAHNVLGNTIYKIGSTTEKRLEDRLDVIGRDEYGAWTYDHQGSFRKDPGFRRWVAHAIHTTRGSKDATITVATRSLAIRLPPDLDRRRFDAALHAALAPWSLQHTHTSIDRYTKASIGTDRITTAKELYVGLDPRHDGDRLLEIIEGIMARYRNDMTGPSIVSPLQPANARRTLAPKNTKRRSKSLTLRRP